MLQIRTPWNSQPQEVVELNDRLPRPEIAFSASTSDLYGYYDLARGRYDAWVNPAHTIVPTAAGIGIRPNFANTFTRTQPGATYDIDLAPAFAQFTVWISEDLGTHTGATFRLSALSDTSSARAYLNLTAAGLQLVTHITTTNTAVAAADLPRGLVSLGLAVSDTESKVYVNGRLVYTFSHAALAWVARPEGLAFYGLAGAGTEGENRLLHAARWLDYYDQFAEFATADPWQLFAPQRIWVPVSAGGGGTTYTITPSGGINFAGTSVDVKGKVIAPSGGVTFAGTGSMAFATTGTEYVITPSGGITFAGTGVQVRSKTITPTGGITFSGSGLDLRTKVIDISGGVTFGGTGNMTSNTSVVTGTVGERTKVGVGT